MHEFDLEKRTTEFAKRVIRLCHALPKNSMNSRLVGQVVGSAGSIGANYREANDSLGKKDFAMRMRIARKESKECFHWLELISEANPSLTKRMTDVLKECQELKLILSSIIQKVS